MLKVNITIFSKELFMLQNFSNSVVSKLFIVSKLYYFHSFRRPFSVFFRPDSILSCIDLI